MAAASPVQIICGVTCACAEETKAKSKADVDCIAHETCPYLKDGKCSCDHGKCVSSQNKRLCTLASEGRCDCAAGACKKMLEIKKDCSASPNCDCAAGECKKTTLPIS
ncbi:hypothetical protein P389DRAFT_93805 [Cystobasidium minutum MCA 4210]|uniref:uncharacterized protein n=1 Tax=Cystobasidium minutum MCA 4210 TaxID=1397322 RepID=UPI0034CD72F7|eukprot:jgi/Rhomi1/93805/CE93804_38776